MLHNNPSLYELVSKLSPVLGATEEEIMHSERFEQTVYDMAATHADKKIPAVNVSGCAQFCTTYINNEHRIEIKYEGANVSTAELADFYHKHFPDTGPTYTYGLENSITFLFEPFINKVLPAMKLWRSKPSCIADNRIDYVDKDTMTLTSSLKPGLGSAVFISGADPVLGKWETAHRLIYNNTRDCWEFTLPKRIKEGEFKFLTGAYDLGTTASTAQLAYEAGDNRNLVIHDHVSLSQPPRSKPEGIGLRC